MSEGFYSFRQVEPKVLDYLNAWTLSKLLIQLYGGDNLQVLPLKVRDHMVQDDGAFPLEPDGEALPLAATVHARSHAAPSQLDALKETKLKSRKQRGPTRKFTAPVPDIAGPMPMPEEHLWELSSEDASGDASDGPPPPDRRPRGARTIVQPRPEGDDPGEGDRPTVCVDAHQDYADLASAPPSVLAALFGKKSGGTTGSGSGVDVAIPPVLPADIVGTNGASGSGGGGGFAIPPGLPGISVGTSGASGSGGGVDVAIPPGLPPDARLPGDPEALDPPPAKRNRNTVRVDHGMGYILKNEAGRSIDGHCDICGMAVNRRWTAFKRARSLKTLAQGKPMGMLLALLDECPGDAAEHRAVMTGLTHEMRVHARQRALTRGGYAALFALERDENDGDRDGEPLEIP